MSNDSFRFLYNIASKIPNENSKPATPKIKNEILNKVISQYTAPNKTANEYKISHTSSDIKRILIKFLGLKDIKIKTNQ
jgi:hypothetical protein